MLWNGIEVDRSAAAEPTPTDRPAAFFIGRHEPRKGLAVLLDAWRTLDRDAVLWVGGAGPQTEELRAETKTKSVEWLGAITDAERDARLRGATVLCAPSLHGESFGVVLLEGMAARDAGRRVGDRGLPQRRARRHRRAAGPARRCRSAAKRRCGESSTTPCLRDRLVTAGRARAEEFSMTRLAERYLELYELALGTRAGDSSGSRDHPARARPRGPGARRRRPLARRSARTSRRRCRSRRRRDDGDRRDCRAGDRAVLRRSRRHRVLFGRPRLRRVRPAARDPAHRPDRRDASRGGRARVVLRVGGGAARFPRRDPRRRSVRRRARDQARSALLRDPRRGRARGARRRNAVADRAVAERRSPRARSGRRDCAAGRCSRCRCCSKS